MEQSTALTTTNQNQALTPQAWQMIKEMAAAVHQARVFGAFSGDEVAIKMLVAHDLGLPLTAALQSVFVVNQKPTIDTLTGMGLIFRSNLLADMKEERLEVGGKFVGWRIWMKRTNGIEVTRTFTMDDAKTAGLLSKDNWKNYPEQMCNYRAKGFASRALFPDVLKGLNFIEEFDQGSIIEGTWSEAPAHTEPTVLEQLLAEFGPDAIMAANGGKIPETEEEITAVEAMLRP